MESDRWISVTVCYALPDHQEVVSLTVMPHTTVLQAIEQSGILEKYPGIEVREGSIGIFGHPVRLDRRLRPHDRVEIYRPLHENPVDARRKRARQG